LQSKVEILRGRTQEDPIKELSAGQYLSQRPDRNVIRFLECLQDENHVYSVMEFCPGGELYEYIEANGAQREDVARGLFSQLLSGVAHLRSMGVCHRDLSLENVLILSDGECKIIDFGMSLLLPVNPENGFIRRMPAQGSMFIRLSFISQ